MNRIPLAPGKSTPACADDALKVFGDNPHGEPIYRLLWSERKRILFAGEQVPEYVYLPHPAWVLEKWVSPEKDAGPEHLWTMWEAILGPYPRKGTYNYVKHYPSDWYPNPEHVRLLAVGIRESQDIAMKRREEAIRDGLKAEQKAAIQKVADEIVELQDSASLGKIQQSVSGPKNTFRTPEDFERDQAKVSQHIPGMPTKGGKILQ